MVRHKALLVGAAAYEAPGVSPLPFVPKDLERMRTALLARGFQQARVVEAPWVTPNVINGEVVSFLAAAGPGDRLLIVLSGHGVHFEGRDYLVPEDVRGAVEPFAAECVEIGWQKELEGTRAEQVVFLIDACREGIERDTKGVEAWGRRKVAAALRRKVVYVYGCSRAQVARFVRATDRVREGHTPGIEPGESFSLFSRAVTDALAEPGSTLADVLAFVQRRIDELHIAYGKPGRAQSVLTVAEEPGGAAGESGRLALFPPSADEESRGTRRQTWADAVTGHYAWQLVDQSGFPAADEVRQDCGRLAAHLATLYTEAARTVDGDPWHDAELAERTTERADFLLRRIGDQTALSPTEAALIAVLPFASQTHWTRQTAKETGTETVQQASRHSLLSGERFQEVLQRFPRLERRLRGLTDTASADAIRWWSLHQWLRQDPAAYVCDLPEPAAAATGFAPGLPPGPPGPPPGPPPGLRWLREELAPERLTRYFKEQRIAPGAVPGSSRGTDLQDERQVASSTKDEHAVRERLVSALLKAAHALAVEPAALPETVVEHLGISDSVSLPALHLTLRRSRWIPSGAGRSLDALCQHPAVELALKRHAELVDVLLRDINNHASRTGSSLAVLRTLPPYANGHDVRPSGSAPANLSTGIRFRLDDDRVQELLMGEQLYGDRALAIRELYQNALDACRYRAARTAYLLRTGRNLAPWVGRISFTQGTDDTGRAFLECADNGIGMGVMELSRAFSRGGSRFVDLPEYIEEGALWSALDPPVVLDPVSRFGLGVLSYFMLADELTVHTCRLDREGRPGHRLKVTIAGPGNLFRVEDLGPGAEAGTTVRLHAPSGLSMPSCVRELADYLWASPFTVEAADEAVRQVWEAGELAVRPPDPPTPPAWVAPPPTSRDPIARPTPYVWYAHEESMTPGYGYGPRRPELPRTVAGTDGQRVWWTSGNGAVLVDGIAVDQRLFGRAVDLRGPDRASLSVDRKRIQYTDDHAIHELSRAAVPDLIAHPELLTPGWLETLLVDDPALGDEIAVQAAGTDFKWRPPGWSFSARHIGFFPPDLLLLPSVTGSFPKAQGRHRESARLLLLDVPEPVLRWRLRVLHGLPPAEPLSSARPSDIALLSASGTTPTGQWASQLREAAERHPAVGPPEDDVPEPPPPPPYGAYNSYGYPPASEVQALGSYFAWLPADRQVTIDQLLDRSWHLQRPVAEIADRLRALGYPVAELGPLADATPHDLLLLRIVTPTRAGMGVPPPFPPNPERRTFPRPPLPNGAWLTPGSVVHQAQLLAQVHPQSQPEAAAARLATLGFRPPERALDWPERTELDMKLAAELMWHPDATVHHVDDATAITRGQLLCAAGHLQLSPAETARRLEEELGFTVWDPEPPQEVPGPLVTLLQLPWLFLPRTRTLPAARSDPMPPYGSGPMEAVQVPWSTEEAAGLAELGYVLEGTPGAEPLSAVEPIWLHPAQVISPSLLRIAAAHAGRTVEEFHAALGTSPDGVGLQLPHLDDHPLDELLIARLSTPLPGDHPDPRPGTGHHIRLAELASAALALSRPFREVTAAASRLGFRHEAEDWF
ncbi:caspase family protein [Streptomyces monticola]|uniref:Caspase family protein n=1 Tax=Streptomyces monticola TaxID=2666263 RepID=A0ABW2JJT3_9ACTN